ncbi:MAG TPA: ABC transporter permease [Candidatus Saccharimonadales bacterium]|nr:ABC transporter permease [Candidatus Saccharimonadales bacterium]
MFKGNYHTAIQNLRINRWRTIFTMLGIIIGITSVVTVVSLGEGLKHQITGQINQLGSDIITVRPGKLLSKNGGGSNFNLYSLLAPSTISTKDVEAVRGLREVRDVTPVEFVTSSASSSQGEFDNVFVAGTGPNFADTTHQKLSYGGYFTDDDSSGNFAVIGSNIAAEMFGQLNPVGETVTIMGQDFIVRGVLAPTQGGLLSLALADYNSSIFIPSDKAEELTAGHTNILQILARVKTGTNINKATSDINKVVAKNHGGSGDFTVLKQNQLLGVSSQVLNTITGFITSIAAISLVVGGIGIMNIMLVSVTERTREIGIRKAIGATNRQIRLQFLTEGLVLSIAGGAIGVIVSLLINFLLKVYSDWKPVVSVWVMVLAVGVSVAAGLIFSLIPAIKAARKDPIAALRGE